ncbi:MAG: 50S ribosomal protein L19 [Patescibacteria group bacterium]|nr:50S ribosomal protein L19 [Patescibacteria group bacterium]
MTEAKEKKESKKNKAKNLKAGYKVRIHQKIKEGDKERIQIFEGIVLKIKGRGQTKTITVRKISEGVGVEKIFPIYSPTIEKIEIVKKFNIRKSKGYYLRNRRAKKLKEKIKIKENLQPKKPA